jgi:hypothetical protein
MPWSTRSWREGGWTKDEQVAQLATLATTSYLANALQLLAHKRVVRIILLSPPPFQLRKRQLQRREGPHCVCRNL